MYCIPIYPIRLRIDHTNLSDRVVGHMSYSLHSVVGARSFAPILVVGTRHLLCTVGCTERKAMDYVWLCRFVFPNHSKIIYLTDELSFFWYDQNRFCMVSTLMALRRQFTCEQRIHTKNQQCDNVLQTNASHLFSIYCINTLCQIKCSLFIY